MNTTNKAIIRNSFFVLAAIFGATTQPALASISNLSEAEKKSFNYGYELGVASTTCIYFNEGSLSEDDMLRALKRVRGISGKADLTDSQSERIAERLMTVQPASKCAIFTKKHWRTLKHPYFPVFSKDQSIY